MTGWACLFMGCCGCLTAVWAEDGVVFEFADRRTNHFAGREATVGTIVRGGAVEGAVVWVLSIGNRSLARGTAGVRHGGREPTRTDIVLAFPEGREGVVVEAVLTAVLVDAKGNKLGEAATPVRIFPRDPFAGRRRWLEARSIAVLDPVGRTTAAFESCGVPFTLVPTDVEFGSIRAELLVIGEGMSWADQPRLAQDLAFMAARGVNVICLAPREGSMPLPGTSDVPGEVVAKNLGMRRADVVAEIDKRLDHRDWSAAGPTVVARFAVSAEGEAVFVRAGDGPEGWPWLEAGFARRETDPPEGKVVCCGLGIVAHWDETPAARYLFAALLERLGGSEPPDSAGSRIAPPSEAER